MSIRTSSARSGIFTTAEYQSNTDFQKTAAVMKLVINGDAAAGTIELGGFDYHTGDRATGEARDFNLGNLHRRRAASMRRAAASRS